MNANQEYTVLGGGSGEANETVYVTQAEYDALTPDEHTDYVIYDTNTSPIGIDAESVSFDNTQTTMQSDNVQDAIEEVFQSVSNGKELLADAITDKGVQTSASDSFSTMAGNIESLMVGGKYMSSSGANILISINRYGTETIYMCGCYSSAQNISNEDIYYGVVSIGKPREGVGQRSIVVFCYNDTTKKIKTSTAMFGYVSSFSECWIRKLDNVVYVTFSYDNNESTVGYFDNEGNFVFDSSVSAVGGTDISQQKFNGAKDITLLKTVGSMNIISSLCVLGQTSPTKTCFFVVCY